MRNVFIALALVSVLLFSCKKNESPGSPATGNMNVYLTDAPAADLDSVVVNVVGMEMKSDDGSFINLNVQGGFINLLDLSNGNKILIATGQFTPRTVQEIRIILGEGNYVVSDGHKRPLKTPSAQESGLKIKLNHAVHSGETGVVVIDFDAGLSIKKLGNGDFMLQPVIRVLVDGGSISGFSSSFFGKGTVEAVGVMGTFGTSINSAGNFMLSGIPTGTYVVTLYPHAPLSAVAISNVMVEAGKLTALGNVSPQE